MRRNCPLLVVSVRRAADRRLASLAAFALVAVSLIGCNRQESAEAGPDPVVRVDRIATVAITGNDKMRYNVTRFTVHPGETVRVTLENVGKMPLTTMGHDLVILKKGEDYKAFVGEVQAAELAQKGEIPDKLLDRVIAHTRVLGPGEKQTIEFVAPEAGRYQYVCTFPTHYVFMHGEMIVE